jgi:hypothetical protein
MFPFWKMIPYTRPHGGIVIGKGGHHIQYLSQQMGCQITSKNAEPERKRFKPYFLIEGYNEKDILMATIHIQGLLMESMMQMDQKQKTEINDLGQQTQHFNLIVSERDEQIKTLTQKPIEDNDRVYSGWVSPPLQSPTDDDDDDEGEDDEDGEVDIITISGL